MPDQGIGYVFSDPPRIDEEPAAYAEPEFTYLDQSARPEVERIRNVLEAWFSRYPEAGRADLRSRLRSTSDHQHRSAFFELLLHELLSRLRCRVTLHPNPPTGTNRCPDFLVVPERGDPFYLEAVVATDESAAERAAQARMNAVYDVLGRLDSPHFFIGIRLRGTPATPPPASKIRSFLFGRLAPSWAAPWMHISPGRRRCGRRARIGAIVAPRPWRQCTALTAGRRRSRGRRAPGENLASVNGHPKVPRCGHRKFPTPGSTPWPRRGGRGRP